MLYGTEDIQKEILDKVNRFEVENNAKVIFGSMVGSISKGMERYDSDYDTRFLYLDKSNSGFLRYDRIKDNLAERDIHKCYIPEVKNLFYDKIAFWELTSFINFLRNPSLDGKFSVGLYHIVNWTFNSPYCYDPYGIKSKIIYMLDAMFQKNYELIYYKNYIEKCLSKEPPFLREYLYSSYYAIAMLFCMKYNRFAPVYFPTLLEFCENERVKIEIKKLNNMYYSETMKFFEKKENFFERKLANGILTFRNEIIDEFLSSTLLTAEIVFSSEAEKNDADYVENIINIIIDSLSRPKVKDVN